MKFVAFVLAAILAFTTALPNENVSDVAIRNSVLEELVLGLLEGLRETMLTGSEDLPILDPLQLDQVHLDLDSLGLEGSHVAAGNIEARELSTFVIDNLEMTMTNIILQRYSIVLEGHIPSLDIDADSYDLSVTALGVHIFGAGSAKMRLIEPRISATIEAGISIFGGISITLRDVNVVFQLSAFEPEITGMFDNPLINDFLNAFLRDLIPNLVEYFEDEISEFLSDLILEIGNEIIGGISLPYVTGKDAALEKMLPILQPSDGVKTLDVDTN